MLGRRTLLAALALAGLLACAGAAAAQTKCGYDPKTGKVECSSGSAEKDPWWASSTAQAIYAVVGLVASAGGAGYAYYRIRRKRKRLAQYLRDIESTYASTKARPAEGLATIIDIRRQVRHEFHAGSMDDGHYLELDKRATDAIVRLRLLELSSRFPTLPAGVQSQVRTLVSDGNVSETDVALVDRALAAHFVPGRIRDELVMLLRAWCVEDEPEGTVTLPVQEGSRGVVQVKDGP